MNKYFTNEYIELCKSEKVQELRDILDSKDYIYFENELHDIIDYGAKCYEIVSSSQYKPNSKFAKRDELIWLPTSGQLDEKIFKILENLSKNEDIEYSFEVSFINRKRTAYQLTISNRDGEHVEMDTNPLVVKIKTLIALLEE